VLGCALLHPTDGDFVVYFAIDSDAFLRQQNASDVEHLTFDRN
jgi:hypothetical protein